MPINLTFRLLANANGQIWRNLPGKAKWANDTCRSGAALPSCTDAMSTIADKAVNPLCGAAGLKLSLVKTLARLWTLADCRHCWP